MGKINLKVSFGYAFIHFSMEVLCFFFLYRVFSAGSYWWSIALVYDTIAFAGQVPVGAFCEKFPRFRPGICGALMLAAGAAVGLIAAGGSKIGAIAADGSKIGAVTEAELGQITDIVSGASGTAGVGTIATVIAIIGFVILTLGNALLHISGALITLRASEGRLSEPGIFVGGGAFGVITGRLLGSGDGPVWIPFILMAVAFILIIAIDRRMSGFGSDAGNSGSFSDFPCKHDVASSRPMEIIIIVLAGVVAVRSYISNGIPMQWKKTVFETVMLYVAMGTGKMAGGVLADIFGTRRVGVISCILAVPFLLLGNDLMWVSLIGIALFSMTMAIALGGIVSVLKSNPGTAFGITTLALFLGSLPVFFLPMPKGITMNVILALMSLLSAGGIYYTVKE